MIGGCFGQRDLVPGVRFLTSVEGGYDDRWRRIQIVDAQWEVVARDGPTTTIRSNDGETHVLHLEHGASPMMPRTPGRPLRSIAWLVDLPRAPYEQIRPLADALLKAKDRNSVYLLVVDEIHDRHVTCRIVQTDPRDDRFLPVGERPEGVAHDGAFIVSNPVAVSAKILESPNVGDLVALSNVSTSIDHDRPHILKAEAALLADGLDDDAIGSWMPSRKARPGTIRCSNPLGLGTWEDLMNEVSRAVARTEPDEILVISALDDPSSGKDDVTVLHLSKTGIKLFHVDTVDDDMWSLSLDPGLWIGEGVSWSDAGDDGAEWAADWRRATPADLLRHGFTAEEVANEATGMFDRTFSVADVEQMLETEDQ